MIEVLHTGALNTVQDLGRHGSLGWGVGTAGAMDGVALAAGNLLLGNAPGCAALEVQVFPLRVRFLQDCDFALTGADGNARLDEQPLLPWAAHSAREGQVLSLGLPRLDALYRSRAYLCLPGGVDVPLVLNSRSTQLRGTFGGLEGRALNNGDVLRAAAARTGAAPLALLPPERALPLHCEGRPAVRVLPAAEYGAYTPASQAAFWQGEWKITPQSDRYGYRLTGQALQPLAPMEMRSHGIVPGVIQVPPDGQPIVQMRDAQPTGGYPKFGTVIEADLWRLGQMPIGSRIRFIESSWSEALDALAELQDWQADLARQIQLYQNARGCA
jgi:biotin-dependent carboxylase-like uncharacterized protein